MFMFVYLLMGTMNMPIVNYKAFSALFTVRIYFFYHENHWKFFIKKNIIPKSDKELKNQLIDWLLRTLTRVISILNKIRPCFTYPFLPLLLYTLVNTYLFYKYMLYRSKFDPSRSAIDWQSSIFDLNKPVFETGIYVRLTFDR